MTTHQSLVEEFAAAVGRGLFSGSPQREAAPSRSGTASALRDRLRKLRQRLDRLRQEGAAPAEVDAILRSLLEIASELVGVGAVAGLRGSPGGQRLGLNLAAALRVLETLPNLSRELERRIGAANLELVLRLLESIDQALLRGLAGPVVSLVEEALQLRARVQHLRRLEQMRAAGEDLRAATEAADAGPERPVPLPPGPIEHYAEQAGMLSLGAFGFGLAATGDLAGAEAAVLGGLPRPAVLGRTAFGIELGRRLEELGALLLEPEALHCLDRIDTLVIDPSLLAGRWGEALLSAAGGAGLLRVLTAPPDLTIRGVVERRIPPGTETAAALRALQQEGHVVLMLAGPDQPTAGADLALAFRREGRCPGPGVHLIGGDDLAPAWLLLSALAPARRCSSQSVQAALMEVVAGMTLCLDGLSEKATLEVNQVAHLLALVAMGNGLRLAAAVDPSPPQPPADTVPWHALAVEEVLDRLGSSPEGPPERGRRAGGDGETQDRQDSGPLQLLVEELDNPLVPVLGTGALLSALMGSPGDAGLILAVLGLNAAIGSVQRHRVESALASLQDHAAAPVWVRRGGRSVRLDSDRLRPGDVVLLEAGEVVPADGRILQASGLQVDEAVLTGESFPVAKGPDPSRAAALAERSSMLYQGTTLVAGEARAVVVATGEATEARRGLAAVRHAGTAGGVEARLEGLTSVTTPIASLSGAALLLASMARGRKPRDALNEAVALAVAAVPEGLPLLSSLAQYAAAGRLSRERVLVRNPRAIESLGRVQLICLDKTGTLTCGHIELVQVWAAGTSHRLEEVRETAREVLRVALRATPEPEPGKRLNHPTDRATRRGAEAVGVDGGGWEPRRALPFEPARGFHASLGLSDGEPHLCVKGAPEVLLRACRAHCTAEGIEPLADGDAQRLEAQARRMAEQGLRVLAVAQRSMDGDGRLDDEDVQGLQFLGFLGLADPVRPTARAALQDLQRAGIGVKIITGDHPATAAAIAADLSLPHDGTVLTGPEIEAMEDGALQQAVLKASVIARVSAMQKLRLVRALRQAGKVVAMTGDGANDAAAIRLADVGIALGEKATEAARQAADMVVTDGRIETIGRAVLEGRALWRSVREAVSLLVGGNLGEIGFTLFSGLSQERPALNTRQLLLLNLLTDVAPALSIAMQAPSRQNPAELLHEGPEASLGRSLDQEILRKGAVTAVSSALARALAGTTASPAGADTVGLLTLVGTQLGQMLLSGRRDPRTVVTGLGSLGGLLVTVQTPGLSRVFGCRPLGPLGLLQAGTASLAGTAAGAALPWLDRWLAAAGPED